MPELLPDTAHYYRNNPVAYDYRRITNDSTYITSHGKTFIVGEHGFYNETSQWDDFYRLLVSLPPCILMHHTYVLNPMTVL
jgi:hypothetical protein